MSQDARFSFVLFFCSGLHQIDRNGRVIDFQKQKGKLHIIEQEFKQAERIEYWRQKEVSV